MLNVAFKILWSFTQTRSVLVHASAFARAFGPAGRQLELKFKGSWSLHSLDTYRAWSFSCAPGFVPIFYTYVTVVLQRVEAAARLGDSQRLASFVAFKQLELTAGVVASAAVG